MDSHDLEIIHTYIRILRIKMNKYRIWDLTKKITLEEAYVPLKLIIKERLRERLTRDIAKEKMKKMLKLRNENKLEEEMESIREKPIEVDKALRRFNRLVILGDIGSGKTALLQYIALKLSKNYKKNRIIPVFISLGEFAKKNKSVIDYLNDKFKEKNDLVGFGSVLRKILNDKVWKVLFLFDGLDEVQDVTLLGEIVEKVEGILETYVDNMFYVSSRETGYRGAFSNFDVVEIKELERPQIVQFTRNVLEPSDNPQKLVEEVNKPFLNELASTPLLLSIISLVYKCEKDTPLPSRKGELYDRCTKSLLELWDKEKSGIKRINKYDSRDKEKILANLAYEMFREERKEDNYLFDEEDVLEIVRQHFQEDNIEYSSDQLNRKVREIVNEIVDNSNLLIKSSFSTYQFLHLSFQEYFAAKYLSLHKHRKERNDVIDKITKNYFKYGYLKETIIFLVEFLKRKSKSSQLVKRELEDIIKKILNPNRDDLFHSNLFLVGSLIQFGLGQEKEEESIIDKLYEILLDKEFHLKRNLITNFCLARRAEKALTDIKTRYNIKCLNKLKDDYLSLLCIDVWDTMTIELSYSLWIIEKSKNVEFLIKKLECDNENIRATAAKSLGKMGDKIAIKPLIKRYNDPDLWVRRKVAEALGEIGGKEALPSLIKMIDDNDPWVQAAAAAALGQMEDKRVVQVLIKTLDDKGSRIRKQVAEILGKINGKKAVQTLIDRLNNYVMSKCGAAEFLGIIGDKEALPSLIKMIDDNDPWVRAATVEALGKIGCKKAIKPLIDVLDDHSRRIRHKVVVALSRLGYKIAGQILIKMLHDFDPLVRAYAVEFLGKIREKKAIPRLIMMLDDHDLLVQQKVANTLGEIGGKIVIRPLIEMLDDDKPSVRATVAEVLGEIGNKIAIQTLTKKLNDWSPEVLWKIAEALYKMGQDCGIKYLVYHILDQENMDYYTDNFYALYELSSKFNLKIIDPRKVQRIEEEFTLYAKRFNAMKSRIEGKKINKETLRDCKKLKNNLADLYNKLEDIDNTFGYRKEDVEDYKDSIQWKMDECRRLMVEVDKIKISEDAGTTKPGEGVGEKSEQLQSTIQEINEKLDYILTVKNNTQSGQKCYQILELTLEEIKEKLNMLPKRIDTESDLANNLKTILEKINNLQFDEINKEIKFGKEIPTEEIEEYHQLINSIRLQYEEIKSKLGKIEVIEYGINNLEILIKRSLFDIVFTLDLRNEKIILRNKGKSKLIKKNTDRYKMYKLLIEFSNRGEEVTEEQIVEAVWPKRKVKYEENEKDGVFVVWIKLEKWKEKKFTAEFRKHLVEVLSKPLRSIGLDFKEIIYHRINKYMLTNNTYTVMID